MTTMTTTTMRLGGKVAVVTGGTSGIGRATAELFARNGARVAIIGRDAARAAEIAATFDGLGLGADVADVAALDAAYARIGEAWGGIDVLFANAGIGPNRMLPEVTPAFFDALFAVNARGAYFTVQRALPWLRDGGSVVLTSSGAAHLGVPGTSVYAAAKAAVGAMARSFAAELGGRGIRVNALSPGLTDTPALSPEGLGMPPEIARGFAEMVIPTIPMRRLGTADEMARAALFLASDATYLTGADLRIDGGLTHL